MTSNPSSAYLRWPVGAYIDRDDPSIVFVHADPDAPGGRFGAIRVGGVWKPASLTIGDVAEDFRPIKDRSKVEALVNEARAALAR